MRLLLATLNRNKTREFRELLGKSFEVIDLTTFPEIEMPEERGTTFEENAISKAIGASNDRDILVMADDSGLEVDALDGAPGIYSARYAGNDATDNDNVTKLLSELRNRNIACGTRSARFRCVIALARHGTMLGTFEGVAEGQIVDPSRGKNGFGYDPVFQPKGFDQTFAEMATGLKNKISHRAKAIAALREALRDYES